MDEDDLSEVEMNNLRKSILKDYSAGKKPGTIAYHSYTNDSRLKDASDQTNQRLGAATKGLLMNPNIPETGYGTIGRGSYGIDENGDIVLHDTWDFNQSQRRKEAPGISKENFDKVIDLVKDRGLFSGMTDATRIVKSSVPTTINLGSAEDFLSPEQIAQIPKYNGPSHQSTNENAEYVPLEEVNLAQLPVNVGKNIYNYIQSMFE